MQLSTHHPKVQPPPRRLVAHLLEVLAECGNVVEGDGGLGVGVVVADEEGLCGFVGDDAFFSLPCRQYVDRWID